MNKRVVEWLVGYLITRLDPEDVKEWVDSGLDVLEDKINEEPGRFDELQISAIKLLRHAFDVPDND